VLALRGSFVSTSTASAEYQRGGGGESDETHPCYCVAFRVHHVFPDCPNQRTILDDADYYGYPGSAVTAHDPGIRYWTVIFVIGSLQVLVVSACCALVCHTCLGKGQCLAERP
jgi:hypothetical protein